MSSGHAVIFAPTPTTPRPTKHAAPQTRTRTKTHHAQLPRDQRHIADHLKRASSNVVLLLAEGANRRGAGLKRQRFVESRGEAGQVAATGDLLLAMQIGSKSDIEMLKSLASREAAMLTGLIARQQ